MPTKSARTNKVRRIYRTLYLRPDVDQFYAEQAELKGTYHTTLMAKVLTQHAEIAQRRAARLAEKSTGTPAPEAA